MHRKIEANAKQGDIVLPKNWKSLNEDEQKEWIQTYYMPKTRIPEPYPKVDEIAKGQKIKTKKGYTIKIPREAKLLQKNPNIEREFEFWLGKWLITVFHDKNCPATKFIGVSNPQTEKWIAQELTIEIWRGLTTVIFLLGHKYRLFSYYRRKSRKKKRSFSLRHKNNTERHGVHG